VAEVLPSSCGRRVESIQRCVGLLCDVVISTSCILEIILVVIITAVASFIIRTSRARCMRQMRKRV